MNDSRVTPIGVNRSTCLPHQFRELPLDVLGLQHAYERAKEIHVARPVAPGSVGYRIFCIFRENVHAVDLAATPDSYLIVGRHTQCDVVLNAEPTIALRHLLVRAIAQADGTVGLRLMDLQTTLAFTVDDGASCRSIFAVGPIAVRLGPYAIVALPLDPHAPPRALPRPTLSHATSAPISPPPSVGGPYRSPPARDGRVFRTSHITILPQSPALEDLPPARRGYGQLTLDAGGRLASVEVPEAELDAGILIGRALKCKDDGLRAGLDLSVSRAHILLLREGGLTCAFDLASMRGTYSYGVRVRRVVLADTGATLALANPNGPRLHWHRRV